MFGRTMTTPVRPHEHLLEQVASALKKRLGVSVDLSDKKFIGRWSVLSRAYHPQETGEPGYAVLIGFPTEANLPVGKMIQAVSRLGDVELVHYRTFRMGEWTLIVWDDEFQRGADLVREFGEFAKKITGQTISKIS